MTKNIISGPPAPPSSSSDSFHCDSSGPGGGGGGGGGRAGEPDVVRAMRDGSRRLRRRRRHSKKGRSLRPEGHPGRPGERARGVGGVRFPPFSLLPSGSFSLFSLPAPFLSSLSVFPFLSSGSHPAQSFKFRVLQVTVTESLLASESGSFLLFSLLKASFFSPISPLRSSDSFLLFYLASRAGSGQDHDSDGTRDSDDILSCTMILPSSHTACRRVGRLGLRLLPAYRDSSGGGDSPAA